MVEKVFGIGFLGGRAMDTEKRISIIIPAKNESESLPEMLAEIPKDLVHEIIVVDGHSTDGTEDVVKKLGHRVVQQDGDGYGMAVNTGLNMATGELITFMDADGSYDPMALRPLMREIDQGYDVVFCSRYLPEAGSDDDTAIRYMGNKLFTWLLRKLHGVQITDALFLYILAKKEIFANINMTSKSFDWCIEFPVRVHQAGLKYKEIPSRERKRIAGQSKVNAFSDGLNILMAMLRLKKEK